MSQVVKSTADIRYKIDDKPPLGTSILLAFQHIMAAFGGIVAVPLVIGGVLGLPVEDMAYLVSCALFAAGIATVIQSKGFGPVGARVACVMGTDFTFVGPSIAVGFAFGLPGIFGATILGSFIEIILSRFLKPLQRFFPPIVTGTVVMLIGLTLLPVSMDWAAGGYGAADYGSLKNVSVAVAVMLLITFLNRYGKGIISSAAVIIGLVFGYIIAYPLGMLDFAPLTNAGWVAIPTPFKYGITFSIAAVVPFITAYMVTTIETVGCLMAIGEASDKELTMDDVQAGVLADGVGILIAGFYNAGPNTSFILNVGLIPLTGVASRFVVIISGIILILMGIFPKVGALVAIMPNPVLGGAGVIMFGMVFAAGAKTILNVPLNNRNLLILAISVGMGLGVTFRPEILSHLPAAVKSLFSSGISAGTITALFLNIVLKEEFEEETTESAKQVSV
jgi:NCS2 family nucleobase:cation symporter-2